LDLRFPLAQRVERSAGRLSESIAAPRGHTTSGAGTEFQKIQAIGKFAQGVQYVSIQTGIGRGGGYKPTPRRRFSKSNTAIARTKPI